MFNPRDIIGEFDSENRIVHLTARKKAIARTLDEGLLVKKAVRDIMEKYLSSSRGYLVTDYGRIIIDPALMIHYAHEMKYLIDTYLYPGGVARYGMDITRITATLSHKSYIGDNANLFNTREEAYDYIYKLIEEKKASEEAQADQDTQEIKSNG